MAKNQPTNEGSTNIVGHAKLLDELMKLIAGTGQSKIQTSFMDNVNASIKRINDSIKNSKATKASINDAYGNSLTSTGTDDKVKTFTSYGYSNDTLNYTLWTALYTDSWVFRKAIDKPSEDMVRAGFELKGKADKTKIYEEVNKLKEKLIAIVRWGHLYGGAGGLLQFDTFKDEDYAKPLNENLQKIKDAKVIRLYSMDRWYGLAKDGSETVTDFASLDFGKPKRYKVTYANGKSITVDHSYILRYEHRDAPNLIKNGQLQGWGFAEGSHILNELARDDQLKSAITSLVNKSLIEVIKMAGMRGVFMGAESESEEQLRKRLEMVNWARTFNSLTFLDKDDEYQEHGFSGLGGLADLLDKNMTLIAASTDMPGILFGDTSHGFANDKDALKRYAEVIMNRDNAYYKPVLDKLLYVLYLRHDIKEDVDYEFISLDAEYQQQDKIASIKDFRQICSDLLGDGVITTKQYAEAFQKFITTGKIDFGFTEDRLKKLDDDFESGMEDIDLEKK